MTAPAAPVALIPAAHSIPVSAVPTAPISSVPTVPFPPTPVAPIPGNFGTLSFSSYFILFSFASLFFPRHLFLFFSSCLAFHSPFIVGPLPTIPSQFEAGSSSAAVPDDVASFFVRFDQPEVNDLGTADFWAFGPPYVDFYGFRVPEDCAPHLVILYSRHGDFIREFRLGRSSREHFLRMLGCVLNDIEHNFIDSVSAGKILQWRATVQELISVGFAVEFILEHLREIARAFFMRRVRPAVEAIDAR